MGATDEGAQKDGEEQQIAEDSNGPCPYFASHATQRRCQAEYVAEDFAHEEGLVPHVNLCVEEPPQNVHDSFLSCMDVFRMRGAHLRRLRGEEQKERYRGRRGVPGIRDAAGVANQTNRN